MTFDVGHLSFDRGGERRSNLAYSNPSTTTEFPLGPAGTDCVGHLTSESATLADARVSAVSVSTRGSRDEEILRFEKGSSQPGK